MNHQKKILYTAFLVYFVLLFPPTTMGGTKIDIIYLTNITASKATGSSGSYRTDTSFFVCSEQQEALALETELSSDSWQIQSNDLLMLLEDPAGFHCKTIRLTFSSQREGSFEDHLKLVFPSTTEIIPLKVIAKNRQENEEREPAYPYSDLVWHKTVINRMSFNPDNYHLTIYGDTNSATFSIHPLTRKFTPLSFHTNDLALCKEDSYCENGKAWDRSHFYRNGRIARYSQVYNNLSIQSIQNNSLSETSTICNSSTVGFEMKDKMTLTIEPSIDSEILGTIASMSPAMYTRETDSSIIHPEINVPVCGGIDKQTASVLCRQLGWGDGIPLAPVHDNQGTGNPPLKNLLSYECSGEENNVNECVSHCSNSVMDLWAEPQARVACHECRINYPDYSTYERFSKGYPLLAGDRLEIITEDGRSLEASYEIPYPPVALWTILSPESIITGHRHDLRVFQLDQSEFKQTHGITTTHDKYFSHFSVNSTLKNAHCRSNAFHQSGKENTVYDSSGSAVFTSSGNSSEAQGSGAYSDNSDGSGSNDDIAYNQERFQKLLNSLLHDEQSRHPRTIYAVISSRDENPKLYQYMIKKIGRKITEQIYLATLPFRNPGQLITTPTGLIFLTGKSNGHLHLYENTFARDKLIKLLSCYLPTPWESSTP
ncbi:MAG: scavenger receptor cysteine-rich domain-containing protein [Endozoicomonas sp.]